MSFRDAEDLLAERVSMHCDGLTKDRSVPVLRMRNETSKSPIHLALGDTRCSRARPAGPPCATPRTFAGHHSSHKWLAGVSVAVCMSPAQLRASRSFALRQHARADAYPRLRALAPLSVARSEKGFPRLLKETFHLFFSS